MIDALLIPRDIGILRTGPLKPAASPARRDAAAQPVRPPDPTAPTGPRPSFEVTTLQAILRMTPLEAVQATRKTVRPEFAIPDLPRSRMSVDRVI